MINVPKTRQEAMERFMAAKARKRERIEELELSLKKEYEQRTGMKANYFFAM